jgi:hypothetical protein
MQPSTSTLPHDGPGVTDRVRHHTSSRVRARLGRERRANIADTIAAGPEAIVDRLDALGREWNIDRVLMVALGLAGNLAHELERRVDRRFGWIVRAQLAFVGLYAATGWAPPVPVLRRLGFRTQQEIDAERLALKRALENLNATH